MRAASLEWSCFQRKMNRARHRVREQGKHGGARQDRQACWFFYFECGDLKGASPRKAHLLALRLRNVRAMLRRRFFRKRRHSLRRSNVGAHYSREVELVLRATTRHNRSAQAAAMGLQFTAAKSQYRMLSSVTRPPCFRSRADSFATLAASSKVRLTEAFFHASLCVCVWCPRVSLHVSV